MDNYISQLVDGYESGSMTRRQLVAKLGSMVAVLGGAGGILRTQSARADQLEDGGSTFEGTELNHIALRVTDIARSRDFYIKHLGLTVSRQGQNNCFLTCGKNFVALFRSDEARMDHYCYSIKDYDVKEAAAKLKSQGITPDVEDGRIYFPDPDGLRIQLASSTHAP